MTKKYNKTNVNYNYSRIKDINKELIAVNKISKIIRNALARKHNTERID
jgi:hypothetical protein